MKRLIWQLGLPMVVSMILQAVYNIVDTAFVINMGEEGVAGNLALTYAFPIQLLTIAVGVGTGIGINALLSRYLGEKRANRPQKRIWRARTKRAAHITASFPGKNGGDKRHYDLCVDSSVGVRQTADLIVDYIRTRLSGEEGAEESCEQMFT